MIDQNKIFNYGDAIQSLYPRCEFSIYGNDYNKLIWHDENTGKPTKEELELEIVRLQKEYKLNEYQRLREVEYPDFREFLDAFVKQDSEQMNSYITKCMEVKMKYPKPPGVY